MSGALYRIKSAMIVLIILVVIDIYAYQAIRIATSRFIKILKHTTRGLYWSITAFTVFILVWINTIGIPNEKLREWIIVSLSIIYFSKLFLIAVLIVDDMRRGVHLSKRFYKRKRNPPIEENVERISRSEFFAKAALVSWAIPLTSLSFGIISGAHNFQVRRRTIYLPNLPKSFDGILIGQLSDIHAGSLFNKTAIQGGVEMLMQEKPDIVFFTGDLVNGETEEVNDYINVFDKIKAPLGVYSVTGNHDYGNYRGWSSAAAEKKKFR